MNAGHKITDVSKIVMAQAANFVPTPFNAVCSVTSELLDLSNNCAVNTARRGVQAGGQSASYLVRSAPSVHTTRPVASRLEQSVELLIVFQPSAKSQSFVEMIKRKLISYSSSTAESFAMIHEDLSMIMQDRLFVSTVTADGSAAVAVVVASPTLEQIAQALDRRSRMSWTRFE